MAKESDNNFMHKFLMYMGIIMLYIAIVYIVPNELNVSLDSVTVIAFSAIYITVAGWYLNDTFKDI